MSADKGKKQIAFGGLMLVNFIVMFLIAGVGVYSYTIAAQFESLASVTTNSLEEGENGEVTMTVTCTYAQPAVVDSNVQ